jgi:hypothetical protein
LWGEGDLSDYPYLRTFGDDRYALFNEVFEMFDVTTTNAGVIHYWVSVNWLAQ